MKNEVRYVVRNSFIVRSYILVFIFGLAQPEVKANEYRFFRHFEPKSIQDELWKEVRKPEDLVRLSVVPTDIVEVIVTRREDRSPLLRACAEARLETIIVWLAIDFRDEPTPLSLGPLISEGNSSLRYLSVHDLTGNDGWEELPAERFPNLEYLEIGGGRLTRESGKWFATLPRLTRLSLSPEFITDGTISALGTSHLKALDVNGDDISCNCFRTWAGNETLEFLSIASLNADSPDDTNILAGLTNLRHLQIDGELSVCLPMLYQNLPKLESLMTSGEEPGTMEVFSEMPNLRHLQFGNPATTSEDLEVLCDGASLESLLIGSTNIDDKGVRALVAMPRLRSLGLDSKKITDASMDILSRMQDLEYLSLYCCNVTTDGFAKLRSLKKMRCLDIRFTEILPDAMPTFVELEALEEVIVTGPKWKPADNEKLRMRLPHLRVTAE